MRPFYTPAQPTAAAVGYEDILGELWFFERIADGHRFMTWDAVVLDDDVPDVGGKTVMISSVLAERYADKDHRKVNVLVVLSPSLSATAAFSEKVLSPSHIARLAPAQADDTTLAAAWYFTSRWISKKLESFAATAREHMAARQQREKQAAGAVKTEPGPQTSPALSRAGKKKKPELPEMGSPAQTAVERALAKEKGKGQGEREGDRDRRRRRQRRRRGRRRRR